MNRGRLFRSRQSRIIGGVAGGIAEYFEIDPVIVRVLFALAFFAGGGGVLIYLILWIAVPEKPFGFDPPGSPSGEQEFRNTMESGAPPMEKEKNQSGALVAGAILIIAGSFLLFQNLFDWFRLSEIWPVILIAIGAFFVYKSFSDNGSKQP